MTPRGVPSSVCSQEVPSELVYFSTCTPMILRNRYMLLHTVSIQNRYHKSESSERLTRKWRESALVGGNASSWREIMLRAKINTSRQIATYRFSLLEIKGR